MSDMGRFEHGGDVYNYPGALDFSASLNPLGMPAEAKAALVANVDAFEASPDPLNRDLIGAIAQHEGVSIDQVAVTAGATDLFSRIARIVQPRKILVPAPSFSGYEFAFRSYNTTVLRHYLSRDANFDIDETFLDKITEGVWLVFLCNPNNPTGRPIEQSFVEKVCERAREYGALVILDECFAPLAGLPSMVPLLATCDNLLIINAFTKTYAMAGLRVGYCIGDPVVIERLRDEGDPWAVSTPAQVAGVAALADPGYVARSQEYVKAQRPVLAGVLRSMGMDVVPSVANFLLFASERPLYASLLNQGIVVRRCGNFEGLDDSWYRVAVRTEEENVKFAEALKEVVLR